MRYYVHQIEQWLSSRNALPMCPARWHRAPLAVIVCLFLLTAGCEHDAYLLEITPDDDGFQRQLTAWHTGPSRDDSESSITPIDSEQVIRLEQLYGSSKTIEDGKKYQFSGHFTGNTPDDIGGYGSLVRHASPLGDATIYSERFRGSADLEQQLAARRAAIDQLIDLTIGWFRTEVEEVPDFAKLERFLNEELRHDLKNVATYAWTAEAIAQYREGESHELAFRLWQYLCEHGYLLSEEIPRFARAMTLAKHDPEALVRSVQRVLARKIGVDDDQPIPASLAWLSDIDRAEASLKKHLRQTEIYQTSYRQWQSEHAEDPDLEEPDPIDVVLGDIVARILDWQFGGVDTLEVRLHCTRQPFEMNGQWNAETAEVTWSHELASRPLAAFSYAAWSEPRDDYQRDHFGRILLSGEALAKYAIWYNGLAADELTVWDDFVEGCQPGDGLHSRIESFRFADESDESAALSAVPRDLMLEALDEACPLR